MRAIEALLVLVLLTAWVVGFVLILRNIRRRKPRWQHRQNVDVIRRAVDEKRHSVQFAHDAAHVWK